MSSANSSNGPKSQDAMSVSEIKAKAKEAVQKEGRRASAMSLIKTARAQLQNAKDFEVKGDLKSALASFIKTASLMKMAMDSPEFSQLPIREAWNDLVTGDCKDLTQRTRAVEEKLKAIEKQAADAAQNDGPEIKAGGSIAERVRALQDSGLSVGTAKRFSREVANLPTPPTSPSRITTANSNPVISSIVPPTPVSPSPHTLVSPSSFGPPSPSSSPSSSPQFDIQGFSQTFPSIDELDEHPAFSLPSVPTGINGEIHKPTPKPLANGDAGPSPLTSFRNYAVHIERPSSTPIPPIGNSFASRPGSPSRSPFKPSNLTSSSTPKIQIPNTNSALPKDLLNYIREYNVLLIDVRNREDFDKEHIKASAVICVEPTILKREHVNADSIEDAMVIAPRGESSLFENRDKFDLVAVYDQSSKSFGDANSPLSILVRIISEQAFKKMLKRMPMMLIGGIDAWKRDLGGAELVKGESAPIDVPRTNSGAPASSAPGSTEAPKAASPSSPNPNNPFTSPMFSAYAAGALPSTSPDPHQVWTPRPSLNGHVPSFSLDTSAHSRSPADHSPSLQNGTSNLTRRPAMVRPASSSISLSRSRSDLPISPLAAPQLNGHSSGPISYPSFPRRISPTASGSAPPTSFQPPPAFDIASPPQASINPSTLSRRRSDYVDQSQEALSALQARSPIDYPELSNQILRPPPLAAAPGLDRQDNRPRVQHATSPFSANSMLQAPKAPRINSDYPPTYWTDVQIGTSGLKNLGNTCYMNAPIQCLSATVPFARFFTEGRWKTAINYTNSLGSQGRLVQAFAKLVHEMWGGDLPYLTPMDFRKSICQLNQQYIGSDQHDSQEFLSFLLDGVHEDLNRVMVKPKIVVTPEQEAELERLPPMIASDREWRNWKARNDSIIVDFFQGQFRSRLQCLTCEKTSTTYNVFSILQVPIPNSRSSKVPLQRCLDALFNEEVLEKDDAWDCPQCKTKRRASKTLSLARLPPILLIHLKRFEANGRFSDKIDTFVEFPMKSLDLTNYMPPPLPPGADKSEINGGVPMSLEDPRTQVPPYKYDLYGVTNHYGNLSSGHYTAYIASRGGWMLCDDSSVKPIDPRQVVNQKAYVLFYKRVRA
ncbi:ubiquitin carboxyl-terminal hydrolase 4 [Coprinopsis cinerea okayama7|uniref:ubiquitinyl hydrolase 1 n=1 Tax=Coprinopsis cinerea (strain Okayama-7 / 130 / ATCC MYA-4618 / FGSC 9003) TaxID=240176 RepID=A8N8Q0_COPC7|nr:ubiquitin carboxyl-terminal hydrolase 4 [Coprinopsis cinerea okayama7\|eukprot:XP_001831228.2 ubiquitin carboxyl-terminal hydrolase 4 [Coprinopsis cinerea okayama7\